MHLHGIPRRDEPPPREVPNYASRLLWAIWSLTIAAAVFLALRVYCKLSRHRSLWWDDHFLIASWVRNADFVAHVLKSSQSRC